ncbi:MAG: DUF3298 domain-containing protein [Schwartzia sp.]|nr:DUF3298 domain-containing protein [Schwartzia sp. (in: firmicutes)]
MKKKTICALALCAALSVGGAPVPQLDAPVALAAEIDASIQYLPLTKRTRYFADGDQTGALLTSRWTSVNFVGSGGNIADALSAYSAKEGQDAEDARVRMTDEARHERTERLASGSPFYGPFERTRDIFVRRADSRVVSLMESVSSYTGGVHGMYGVGGVNFDARTGQQLALSDVCPDMEGLIAAIIAQMGFDYPDASFMQNGSTLMQDMVRQMVSDGVIPWTLDARGVSFYFNPYLIASYAEGIFTTTILFSEHPELFAGDYGAGPAAYAMELQPYLVTRLSDSPRDHRLTVSGRDKELVITFGGMNISDPVSVEDVHPVVVGLEDGRHYLYVDCLQEGRRVIRVYALDMPEPKCIGVQPITLLASPVDREDDKEWYVITDPMDFSAIVTEDRGLPVGTQLRCKIGSDGRIEYRREG